MLETKSRVNNYTRKEVTYTRINTRETYLGKNSLIQLRYRLLMMSIAYLAMTTSYQGGTTNEFLDCLNPSRGE